jgi:DHA2 family multidrug resistance protein
MSESRRLLLTLTLALATFMQVLDTSIANVSIPAISLDLASPQNQGVWVITAFAASNGISMLLTG